MCRIIFVQKWKMQNFLKDMIKIVAAKEHGEMKWVSSGTYFPMRFIFSFMLHNSSNR